jgi:beta-lactamase class A
MLSRKIPLYFLLASLLATNLLTFFVLNELEKKKQGIQFLEQQSNYLKTSASPACQYNIARLNGYRLIRPLIFAEPTCETENLQPIKQAIEEKINNLKHSGLIRNASVYLRLFNRGEWISVEDQEKYSPGSLLKVPELITIMKMKETNPDILKTKLLFEKPIETNKTTTFVSKGIEPGKSYTVQELLHYMIAYSDNNATYLLNKFMDMNVFKKVFTDLGLPEPDMTSSDYKISAREFSIFMKVLYNASYLSIKDSEFCTELLAKCDFNKGLVAGVPEYCQVAHKFGEGGDASTQTFNLSESGLVYCNNKTYLLTVMTNGNDMKSLAPVITSISNLVYNQLEAYYNKRS